MSNPPNAPGLFADNAATPPGGATTGGATGAVAVLRLHDPINILIVDDEPKNLTVLETILDSPDYRLVRAQSADEALLALVAKEFALLILDVRMPVMTGFELAHLIRQRKKTEQVPIIFLTAYYNEDQHVLEGYGTGAVDYLHKPVNPLVLRSKVAIFADLHRKTRALEVANRALVAEVTERRDAQTQLRELNETLEERVLERTAALLERTQQEAARREQLRASEEFNRSLMEGTADCVQVLDLQGRLLHVNGPGMAQMEISDFAAISGKHWWLLWPGESSQVLVNSLQHAQAGAAASFTAPRPTSTGTRKWWNVSVSPVRDSANGQVVRILAVARDVTEAREIEQALRASDEQKDNFIATLAHELRNPLAPIRNAVNVMRRTEPASSQLAWCRDVIDRQAAQMSRLLDDLLDVSRYARSKLTLRRDALEVSNVIEHAIEIAQPWIDQGGQTFEVTLPPAPIVTKGDLARLAQVISNLLINAAKYTAADGLIQLSALREGDELVVRVKDDGIGIAAEHLPRVFEMFSQVPSAQSHSHGGLGIGLALARGLVELHGGRLSAYSAGPAKGSEFVVRLPLTDEIRLQEPSLADAAVDSSAVPKCCILVVDDSHDSADSLTLVLQVNGHDVHTAYEGERAILMAQQFRPDVALIDLGMPKVDGYEVCRRIRAHPWGVGMLLIAQTGWGQEYDRRRTEAAGFDHHLVKPLDFDVLNAHLRRVATRSATR
jgi:PAS domain S-box-containing protein